MRREDNTGATLPDDACIQHDRRGCVCQSPRERAGRSASPDDSARSENGQRTQSPLVGASSRRTESASTRIPVSPSGSTFLRMRLGRESAAESAVLPRLSREGSIEIRRRTSYRGHAVDTCGPQ